MYIFNLKYLAVYFLQKTVSHCSKPHIRRLKNKQPNKNKPSTWVIHLSHCLTAVLGMAVAMGYCRALGISALPITSRLSSISPERQTALLSFLHHTPTLMAHIKDAFFLWKKKEIIICWKFPRCCLGYLCLWCFCRPLFFLVDDSISTGFPKTSSQEFQQLPSTGGATTSHDPSINVSV